MFSYESCLEKLQMQRLPNSTRKSLETLFTISSDLNARCFPPVSNFQGSIIILNFSIDKIPRVTSPVLVIHGTEDEVIDFSHGLAIYERCPRAVEPLWVEVR